MERYERQMLVKEIGTEGQKRLGQARVLLVGCGGLGTNIANILVRAGVGFIRIIDKDRVELSNLQRQCLYDEEDAAGNLPKVEAARRVLTRINSSVEIETLAEELTGEHQEVYCRCSSCDGRHRQFCHALFDKQGLRGTGASMDSRRGTGHQWGGDGFYRPRRPLPGMRIPRKPCGYCLARHRHGWHIGHVDVNGGSNTVQRGHKVSYR